MTEPAFDQGGGAAAVDKGEDDAGCGAGLRNQFSAWSAGTFAGLGGAIARNAYVFAIVTPLFWGLWGIGLIDATLETDVDKLWVNKGSRLEDEKDFYDRMYGGLTRYHQISMIDKHGRDNVLSTAHLDDVKYVNARTLDMRPWHNPNGICRTLSQAQCVPTAAGSPAQAGMCTWDAGSQLCLDSDILGLKPSFMQKEAINVTYMGVQWGLREVCREKFSRGPLTGSLRMPCSYQQTPMDCFKEPPVSFQSGVLRVGGSRDITKLFGTDAAGEWVRNHPISYADDVNRGLALANPCWAWSGTTYTGKGASMGGLTTVTEPAPGGGTRQRVTKVKGWRMAHVINNAKQMVRKWEYLKTHSTSWPLYVQAGFPTSLTEAQAEELLELWEKAANDRYMEIKHDLATSELAWANVWSVDKIVDDASSRNKELVVVGFVLLAVVVWGYMLRCDKVHSRLLLGLAGILCIALAVLGTLGFAAACQIDFNGLTMQVLPYVTMGLGIDDMFVLIHYFHPPSHKEDVELRMRQAFAHAGPSVLATSLVNLTVFLLSSIVPVNAVQSFAWQSAIAVAVNFTIIFFGFGAFLALDARRMAGKRMDCCFCMKDDSAADDEFKKVSGADEAAAVALRGFGNAIIGSLAGRIAVLVVCCTILGIAIGLGCTNIDLGLPLSLFVEEGSVEQAFLRQREGYLPHAAEGAVVVGGMPRNGAPMEWPLPVNQYKLNKLVISDLQHPNNAFGFAGGMITLQDPQYATQLGQWSTNFRSTMLQLHFASPTLQLGKFYDNNTQAVTAAGVACAPTVANRGGLFGIPHGCHVNENVFYEFLGVWCGLTNCLNAQCTAVVTARPEFVGSGAVYCDDLILSTNNVSGVGLVCNGIEMHQTTVVNQPADVSSAGLALDIMEETRGVVDSADMGLMVIGRVYLYNEQYRFTRYNLRLVLSVTMAVVTCILMLLFQSFSLALIQAVVIGCSTTCIIALIPALDISLNAVSLLSIVFGVSINVELCVHIARAFDTAHYPTKAERAVEALGQMGAPVLCGACTTFLSVVVLAGSDTQFFREYFFQFYSCMIAVSLFFAWTLLPTLLCLFGPAPILPFPVDSEDPPSSQKEAAPVPVADAEAEGGEAK